MNGAESLVRTLVGGGVEFVLCEPRRLQDEFSIADAGRDPVAPTVLWDRLASGERRNVGFPDFCRLVEAFGFELRRVSGSHHIYSHPSVPRPLSLQLRQREAKPYQISQFLEIVAEYGLTMEPPR